MAPRERPKTPGRFRAIALSFLLHSGIVAAAVFGWFTWKHRPPPVTAMPIEATVVDERALKKVAPPPKPEPPPPEPVPEPEPVEEQGPPKPDPAELEKKEQERIEQEKQEQEKKAQELKEKEEAERIEKEKQAAAEKAAAEKAAADKKAADKKAAEKKKAEEAAAAKKAAEDELRKMLEAEERGEALRNSPEAERWYAQIRAKISSNWNRPASAQPGITCIVLVNQVSSGEVTSVRVDSCSINDAALRASVEAAVYKASPLPLPPNPALFQRNLKLEFAPQ